MITEEHLTEERLLAVSAIMKSLVDDSVREGMMRAVPDPIEASQLSTVYSRLQQRIRGIEIALHEFDADLQRVRDVFARAERRVQTPAFLLESPIDHPEAVRR